MATTHGNLYGIAPARPPAPRLVHAVSEVRLDAGGRIVAVRWGEVDIARNDWSGPEVIAPVAAVVAALNAGEPVFALFPSEHGHVPERHFIVVDYDDGRQAIALDGPATHEREVHDMGRIAGP